MNKTVVKGQFETAVNEKDVKKYLNAGWKLKKEPKKEQPKTYNDYTKKQLIDIGANRNILLKTTMKKKEMIERLNREDDKQPQKPTNKGFTDNLIK